MRGLILRRKTGTVSVEVFTFHVHLAFERHTGTEDVSSTFVQCLFCKNCVDFGVYLGVRTCELFLCFVAIVRVRAIMLTSLFSLFYVSGEFHRFLHRGRAGF